MRKLPLGTKIGIVISGSISALVGRHSLSVQAGHDADCQRMQPVRLALLGSATGQRPIGYALNSTGHDAEYQIQIRAGAAVGRAPRKASPGSSRSTMSSRSHVRMKNGGLGCGRAVLTLQLRPPPEVQLLRERLVSAAPHRSGDHGGRFNRPPGQPFAQAADFLDRPAHQRRIRSPPFYAPAAGCWRGSAPPPSSRAPE